MTATVDPAPYGTRMPHGLDRALIALARRLPANWFGLRASMPMRRIVINRLGDGALDTTAWGVRLRLYPRRNGCEKMALFTPQLFDVVERTALAAAIAQRRVDGEPFTFVDIGANVGLYALFVAARAAAAAGRARVLAIEPQPGIVERLRFNVAANPELSVTVVPVALADYQGEVELAIDNRDSGGTRLAGTAGASGDEVVRVPCRPLASVLAEAGFSRVDALKIDVEGVEDLVLAPFLRETASEQLPRLLLIEDWGSAWKFDLFGLLKERGYAPAARSRHNVAFRLAG